MARRVLEERNVRKVSRMGNGSTYVVLPAEIVRELGWREKQKVVVKKQRGGIFIADWKK